MAPISPELVLVDPELARRARALLPPVAILDPPLGRAAPSPSPEAARGTREPGHSFGPSALAAFGVILFCAATAIMALSLGSSRETPHHAGTLTTRAAASTGASVRREADGRSSRSEKTIGAPARAALSPDRREAVRRLEPHAPAAARSPSAGGASTPPPNLATLEASRSGGSRARTTPAAQKMSTSDRPRPEAATTGERRSAPTDKVGRAGAVAMAEPGPAPLRWRAVPGASRYLVRVYRAGSGAPLLELTTTTALAELPSWWLGQDGTRDHFTPGSYRWDVYPMTGAAGSGTPTARPATTGTFVLEPPR